MNQPTEQQLNAWLDSELPADEQARIADWLAAHPDEEAQVRLWAADREGLRAHGETMLAEPVPERLRNVVRGGGAPAWRQAAAMAGLVVGGAVLGAGGFWQWQQWKPGGSTLAGAAPWVQRAAYAHAVYVPEPRHPVEVRAQEEHLARWLTRRIDVDVKLFDLRAHGFELVGGRLLPDGAGKSAQLMYQDAKGVRVTVYLRKPDGAADTAFRYERQGDLGLFYWVEPGCGYAIVGPLPRETLLALAQAIDRQDPSGAARP
jgi:anti-sigma factor RsiW